MTTRKCDICGSSETDDLNLGEWKELNSLRVHYFCVLLSTNIAQRGEDDEGILGFLEEDIRAAIKISKRQKCYFCKKTKATIYCKGKCVSRAFHLSCGIKNNCLFQFVGAFDSFCPNHLPMEKMCKDKTACIICEEFIFDLHRVMRIPSCCGKYWFHRDCIKRYALSAGYYAKCVGCDSENTDAYRDILRMNGVFVPDRDALWEQTQDAYSDLLHKHNRCDAAVCRCSKGPTYSKNNRGSKWFIKLCKFCAAQGIHNRCLNNKSKDFICNVCIKISQKNGLHEREVTFYISQKNSILERHKSKQTMINTRERIHSEVDLSISRANKRIEGLATSQSSQYNDLITNEFEESRVNQDSFDEIQYLLEQPNDARLSKQYDEPRKRRSTSHNSDKQTLVEDENVKKRRRTNEHTSDHSQELPEQTQAKIANDVINLDTSSESGNSIDVLIKKMTNYKEISMPKPMAEKTSKMKGLEVIQDWNLNDANKLSEIRLGLFLKNM